MSELDPDDDLLAPASPSFDPSYVADLVEQHRKSTSRRKQHLIEMWILETVVWNDHPELDTEGTPKSIQEWVSMESRRKTLRAMDTPPKASGEQSDEEQADEPAAFASFSKEEVDYLNEVISGTDDQRAKNIVQSAYPDTK